ncbi:MAG: MBG domain-containing protein, partial [Legionellales bacterium]
TINDTLSGSLGRAVGENVGTYAYTLGSVAANDPANYSTGLGVGSFAITPATLTINSTASQSVVYGNSDPVAGFSYGNSGLVNGVTPSYWNTAGTYVVGTAINDSVSGSLGRAVGENVGSYAYTLGTVAANDPANYTTSLGVGSFAITPATLTINPTASQSVVYGNSDPVAGFSYGNSGLVNGVTPSYWNTAGNYVVGTAINDGVSGSLGRAAGENVGTYVYTLGTVAANDPANYTTGLTAGTFTITPATLAINPNAGQNIVYGNSDPAAGFTYTNIGLVNNVAPSYWNSSGSYVAAATINDSISGKMGRVAGENVGNYAYTIGSLAVSDPANYNTPSFGGGTFAITPAALTASIANQDKIYGTNDPSIASILVNLNGIVNTTVNTWDSSGQYVSAPPINDTGNVTSTLVSLTRVSGEAVAGSPYAITAATFTPLSGSAAGNYTGLTYTSGSSTLTINPTGLTVTANNASKAFGSPDPQFTYSEMGLITNSSVTDWMNVTTPINDSLSGSLNRIPGNAPGDYPIILGTLSAGSNYQITYNDAFLTIEPPSPAPTPTPLPLINDLSNLAVIINGTVPTTSSQSCNTIGGCGANDLNQYEQADETDQINLNHFLGAKNANKLDLNTIKVKLSQKAHVPGGTSDNPIVHGPINLLTPINSIFSIAPGNGI